MLTMILLPFMLVSKSAEADAYTINAVSLANYISDSTYIRFGGFRGSSYTGDMAIDDIRISECPPVMPDVAVSNITSNSAIISWSSNSSYQAIVYDTAGFDMDSSGTTVVTSSPFELTGLSESTNYGYYLMDSCGGSLLVSGPYTFLLSGRLSYSFWRERIGFIL